MRRAPARAVPASSAAALHRIAGRTCAATVLTQVTRSPRPHVQFSLLVSTVWFLVFLIGRFLIGWFLSDRSWGATPRRPAPARCSLPSPPGEVQCRCAAVLP